MVPDRYLYHCFPRRGANSEEENAKGLKILSCIRDFGLLLLPESIEWSQPVTNQPPRTIPFVQSRVCFTDLTPAELTEHASTFGHFALEFEIEVGRLLGAIPVFYIPQKDGGVGASLVTILLDAKALIDRASILYGILNGATPVNDRLEFTTGFARNPQDRKKFDIDRDESRVLLQALGHQTTPWPMLSHGMDAALSFFYPADDVIHNKPLQYYQQREWRIACNFAIDGLEIMRRPKAEEVKQIVEIDEKFFGSTIETDLGSFNRLDRAFIHPGIDGKTILQLTRRLVVPSAAVERCQELIGCIEGAPLVVAMEDL